MEPLIDERMLGALREPFPGSDVHWRVGRAADDGRWVQLLAYVDARDVQRRLDEVFGCYWQTEFKPHPLGSGAVCRLTVSFDRGLTWVSREDGADPTDVEAAKGVLSDAFKRAAVQFGVARHLYGLGTTWGEIHASRREAQDTGRPCGEHRGRGGSKSFWWSVPMAALSAVGAPTGSSEPTNPQPSPSNDWRSALQTYLRTEYKARKGLDRLTIESVDALAMELVGRGWDDLDETTGAEFLRALQEA